jgi:hypothetical protein
LCDLLVKLFRVAKRKLAPGTQVWDPGVGGSNPLSPTNYLEETSPLNNFLQRSISLRFWIVSNPIGVVD